MHTTAQYISGITIPLPPARAYFGRVIYSPGSTLGPRLQNDLQLMGLEEGRMRISIDGKEHELPEGWMCLLRPGCQEFFRFAAKRNTRHNWCTMNFPRLPKRFTASLADLPFAVQMTPLIESLMEWGLQNQTNPLPVSDPLSIHLGQGLLYAWLNAIQPTAPDHPDPSAVALAKAYISRNHPRPILIDDIAEAAHVSVTHLTRLFNEHLHTTPIRYLWQYRTQRGVDLLRHTGLNVTQIAQRVGFATPFHFSRLVKQMHHLSPRQLRDKFWKLP